MNRHVTNDKSQAGAVSYAYQFHCPNDQNLIAVLGRALGPVEPPPPIVRLGVRPKSLKLIRAAAELRLIDVPRGAATLWLHSFRPPL